MADWSVLGEDSDPIPGDPYEVAALGKQMRETANMISKQSANIKNLTDGPGWDSDAGDEFKKTAGDTAGKLLKAYDRYDGAATALGESVDTGNPERNWASALYHAQTEARQLLTKAEHAHADSQGAATALGNLPKNDTSDHTTTQHTQLSKKKSTADGELSSYKRQLGHIKDFRDSHASKAASAIGKIIGHDGVHDTTWDKIAHVLSVVSHIAGVIAAVAGALSLVLGWVPFLGQALVAIAAVASIVALLCDLALAIGGKGNWLDVGLDLIGCLSFGAGRLLGDGVKVASVAARGEAVTRDASALMEVGMDEGAAWDMAAEFSGGLKGGDALEAAVRGPSSWLPKGKSLMELARPLHGTTDAFKEANETWKGVHSVSDFLKLAKAGDPAVTEAAHAAKGVSEGASGFRTMALTGSRMWSGSQVGPITAGYLNLEKPDAPSVPGEQYLPEPDILKESPFGDLKGWADSGS